MAKLPHLKSKRKKTAILRKHPALRKYIPATAPFSRSRLFTMLMQYDSVYAKPDKGKYGRGIMKIEGHDYRLHYLRRSRKHDTFAHLLHSVHDIKGRKRYIVQQGIRMLTYRGRPFDIRIMVQRSPTQAKRWETTGMLARVAAPGKIVTNFHSGGTAHRLPPLLAHHLPPSSRRLMMRHLRTLGRQVALHFAHHVPGLHELGIDVAIDRWHNTWILEVNTRPDAFIFRSLKNKTMFRKVFRYAQSYGKYQDKLPFHAQKPPLRKRRKRS